MRCQAAAGARDKTDRPAGAHTDDSWVRLANHTLGTGTAAKQDQGKQQRSADPSSLCPPVFARDLWCVFFFVFFSCNERRGRHLLSPLLRPPPFFLHHNSSEREVLVGLRALFRLFRLFDGCLPNCLWIRGMLPGHSSCSHHFWPGSHE